MKNQKFSISDRLKSFKYAFSGMRILFKEEHNSWVHLLLAIIAIITGFLLKIDTTEWVLLTFCIGFVFVAELVNTSIENICDFISPNYMGQIGKIKDLGAAAVLFASLTSFVVGGIIFAPKIIALF